MVESRATGCYRRFGVRRKFLSLAHPCGSKIGNRRETAETLCLIFRERDGGAFERPTARIWADSYGRRPNDRLSPVPMRLRENSKSEPTERAEPWRSLTEFSSPRAHKGGCCSNQSSPITGGETPQRRSHAKEGARGDVLSPTQNGE